MLLYMCIYLKRVFPSALGWLVLDIPGVVEFHRLSCIVSIFTVLYLNNLTLVVSAVSKDNVFLFVSLYEREERERGREGVRYMYMYGV